LGDGIRVQRFIVEAKTTGGKTGADAEAMLGEAYLLHGVESWTLMDGTNPLPVTPETIRQYLLNDFTIALPIAEKADELYIDAVLAPLVNRAKMLSPASPTAESTSALPTSKPTLLKPSKRSSTTTTRTDVTETTSDSLAGASR
jgi:hypothetical protein